MYYQRFLESPDIKQNFELLQLTKGIAFILQKCNEKVFDKHLHMQKYLKYLDYWPKNFIQHLQYETKRRIEGDDDKVDSKLEELILKPRKTQFVIQDEHEKKMLILDSIYKEKFTELW